MRFNVVSLTIIKKNYYSENNVYNNKLQYKINLYNVVNYTEYTLTLFEDVDKCEHCYNKSIVGFGFLEQRDTNIDDKNIIYKSINIDKIIELPFDGNKLLDCKNKFFKFFEGDNKKNGYVKINMNMFDF